MPEIKVIPIRPRNADFDIDAFLTAMKFDARQVAADGKRFIATYPPQTLVKTGYVRTGTLKRSWSSKTASTRQSITITIGSNANIAPYNRVVQGPSEGSPGQRQATIMAAAGWRNADDLIKKVQSDAEKRIQATVDRMTR